ncbi:MAG: purine-nucleoside phosphorylase [Terriglobia bacterium]|jgi:purine-nucleoside phosphorylase|nr:purine-nucleoside phosphorylase [Terriglobia bacterium]
MSTAVERKEDQLDEYTRAKQAADFVLARLAERPALGLPKVAVVLGSGLGDFANDLKDALIVPYETIPNYPRSTAIGHAGRLVVGKLGEVTVAAMQGRVHQYEGYTAKQAAFPVRVFGLMGLKAIVLTNAAGGINKSYGQGALVLLSDHLNLQGANPLTGANDERFGLRFHDMSDAYSKRYREIAHDEARRLQIELFEGVYAALSGPSYETPAEIRYLRIIGADLVGMSTVPEVIVARHMGLTVLAVSCVTNMAAGMLDQPINHEEVLEVGARVRGKFLALLTAVIPRIAATV